MLDHAQPYDLELTPCTIIAVMTSREDLPPGLRDRDLHGLVFRPEAPAAGLLISYLRALDAVAALLTVEGGAAASRALLLLAEAAAPPERPAVQRADNAQDQALFERACAHVEEQIGDPELSLERMAKALGLSRTSLYRLFESAGGAAAYIRERRLLRSHEIIYSDLQPHLSLGEIGLNQGFGSVSYFNRAFKERLGISPGVARKAARARRRQHDDAPPPPQTPGMPPQSMLRQ